MEERNWHYVKQPQKARIPRRHIFLDTEATSVQTRTGHKQSWRLGVAAYRVAEKGRTPKDEIRTYSDPRSLWADVSGFAKPRNRTIVWAHNLAYDLRISRAFRTLPSLGWKLVNHNLAPRGTWLHWEYNGATILMVDATSVYPVPLAQLGTSFMQPKLPLPGNDDPNAAWMARCVRDVEILRDAVLTYLDWIEREGLGSWQLTGAGQSYAAFKARHLTHAMLVHGDLEALEAERRAMWTGRCEAYWRGRTGRVGIEEWDLSLAFCRLAQAYEMPVQLVGQVSPDLDLAQFLSRPKSAILAHVEVTTDKPVVPTKVGDRMAWPVGNFETTLWTPELRMALAEGAQLRVVQAFRYATAPALRQWADWVIGQIGEGSTDVPPWLRIILKHWSRALIGRFGMNYTKWERYGSTDHLDARQSTVYDMTTGQTFELTHIGTEVQMEAGREEWDQSIPAITGYIMSLSRVWLWELINALPEKSVLYVDTDSLWITSEHHDAAVALSQTALGKGLRLKHIYDRATILGPRQIIADGRPRIAGIPTRAVTLASGAIQGEVWESLTQALRRGEPTAVTTTDRTWKVSGVDNRRVGERTGWTQPITVGKVS